MSTSQRYLGARTAFGIIISVVDCLYNPEAVVQAKDGSTQPYRLPFLIAHGLELSNADPGVQTYVEVEQPKG